jgi:hypothetical protein
VSTARKVPRIEAYIGATGSGKGVSIARRLRELKPGRLLIFDPRNQYAEHAQRIDALGELVEAVRDAGQRDEFRARVVPGAAMPLDKAFAVVCDLAFAAGDLVFIAEELSDVTSPSYAPPAWRRCVTQGRDRELHLFAASQRPALTDKTLLGNCTFIRCFALRYQPDRREMARALDVPLERVTRLATTYEPKQTTIHYLERDFTRHAPAKEGFFRIKA